MKYIFTTTASILALYCGLAHANMLDHGAYEELFGEPVTLSANGTPQRESEVVLNMEIITSEQIRESGARSIPDILRHYTGLNVQQVTETQMEVGMRGRAGRYNDSILVLVNGRQVYMDYYGFVAWETIPVRLEEIRQIEVIKGPNTALFGFNAVSGVVNITTFNPLYDDIDVVSLTAGTQQYGEAALVNTMQFEDGAVRLSLGGFHMGRFDKDASTGRLISPTVYRQHKDSEEWTGSLTGVYKVTDDTHLELEVTAGQTLRNESIGNAFAVLDYDTQSYKVDLSHETDSGSFWQGLVYHNRVTVPDLTLQYNNVTVAQLSNRFKVGPNHVIRLMGEYRYNTSNPLGASFSGFPDNQIGYSVKSASAVWDWNITEKLSTNQAVRYDLLQFDYEGDVSPKSYTMGITPFSYEQGDVKAVSINSGLVYTPTEKDTIRLSYDRGIDIPSFLEYSLQEAAFFGNPL